MTRRLVLSYLAVTVFVLIILQLPLAIVYEQRERDQLAIASERDAAVLATIYTEALQVGAELDPGPAFSYSSRTGARVVIVDIDAVSRVDTGSPPPRDFSTRPEFVTALSGLRTSATRYSETLQTELLVAAVPAASGGEVHGAVRLSIDTAGLDTRINRFRLAMLSVAAVVLTVTAAVGWLIARSLSKPIRSLQAAAGRFAEGDLRPLPTDGRAPSEIADLQHSLNSMALQLDGLISRQRHFVADASHQLRTPLTALRLRLENAQEELDAIGDVGGAASATGDTTRPAALTATHAAAGSARVSADLDAAIEETNRLATLVGDLLTIARTDRTPSRSIVDLVPIVNDRVQTWSAVADDAHVAMHVDATPRSAMANPVNGAVEQMLDNLFENALKAIEAAPGRTGGRITVRIDPVRIDPVRTDPVRTDGARGSWAITVADDGPGLDDDGLQRASERFWRGGTAGEGSGLGLSIVEALATASGGELQLSHNSPTGLRATVTLPSVDVAALRVEQRIQ